MNAKEIRARIVELDKEIQDAIAIRNAYTQGSLIFDAACMTIEANTLEIEQLEEQLKLEQAGGEII